MVQYDTENVLIPDKGHIIGCHVSFLYVFLPAYC